MEINILTVLTGLTELLSGAIVVHQRLNGGMETRLKQTVRLIVAVIQHAIILMNFGGKLTSKGDTPLVAIYTALMDKSFQTIKNVAMNAPFSLVNT